LSQFPGDFCDEPLGQLDCRALRRSLPGRDRGSYDVLPRDTPQAVATTPIMVLGDAHT
jgi:hypothetical protein